MFLILFMALVSCQKKQKAIDTLLSFKGPFPDTIAIMEYNIENLFDMVENGMEYPEFKPGAYNWTLSTFQKKLDNIASVISAINPDIAVLVEIENENAMKELLAALKKKKCPYSFYALGDKPNRTVTIPVILSKFPLFNIRNYGLPAMGDSLVFRNLLEADVFLGRDTLKVFACHWPSKKEPESRRVAAARLLKGRLAQISRKTDYVIAGDFNENYDECATFHTRGLDDSYGVTGINHVLGTLRAMAGNFTEYVSKQNIRDSTKLQHFDPWLDLSEDKRMSEVFKHQKNTLDHILLSPALFDSSGLSYVDSSFRSFTWNGRLLFNDAPFRWQMRFENGGKYHLGEGYSDHLPIMAKLWRGPFTLSRAEAASIGSKKDLSSMRTIGFETGSEGWASCMPYISLRRDTSSARSGFYCLRISGDLIKQNGCVAYSVIHCNLPEDSPVHWCSMSVRGRGTLSFRIRIPKNKKWTYYNGVDFKPAKGAKYTLYDFASWTEIKLPLALEGKSTKEIEMEIRAKKETTVELWIDEISVK
jgi:endonuclease/exonuclease/phosphatase family metal-dependent hydrolase